MKTSTTIILCAVAAGVVVAVVVQARKRAAAPAQASGANAAALGAGLAGFLSNWGKEEPDPPPGASSGETGGTPHGTEATGDSWWADNIMRNSSYDGAAPATFGSYSEQSIAGASSGSLYSVAPSRAAQS